MAKPDILNVTVTQTFQNWLDKTNEVVGIVRENAITASPLGDSTNGDAALIGDFTANTVIAFDELKTDDLSSRTPGGEITSSSPIYIDSPLQKIAATFDFAASGAKTRYTNEIDSWDIGIDNSTDFNFVIDQGAGGQFALSPQGVLTVPSLTVTSEINFPRNANGEITGVLTAANAEITDTLVANNAIFANASGGFSGNFTGDVYHPASTGGNGAGKVLENGGPAANIPATFFGNVQGTVSSLTNHKTTNLVEGTNLYFTNARAVGALVAGTGVSIATTADTNGKYAISIGQAVGTSSDVEFKSIVTSGNITAYGTVSDMTMKENIVPIENALDKVSKLGGYVFNYKGDDRQMTGVMAQELMDVLPGVVYETIDPKTKKPVYAVRHGNIIGLLIEAIKELQAKVGK
jgi:hypothetical protein